MQALKRQLAGRTAAIVRFGRGAHLCYPPDSHHHGVKRSGLFHRIFAAGLSPGGFRLELRLTLAALLLAAATFGGVFSGVAQAQDANGAINGLTLSSDSPGTLAALEYVGVSALSMYAMCDPNDLIGASYLAHPDTGDPEVFLLDNHPGGVGISELGYEIVEQVWERMREIIASCPCVKGCPRCVESPTRFSQDSEPTRQKLSACWT